MVVPGVERTNWRKYQSAVKRVSVELGSDVHLLVPKIGSLASREERLRGTRSCLGLRANGSSRRDLGSFPLLQSGAVRPAGVENAPSTTRAALKTSYQKTSYQKEEDDFRVQDHHD
jgi:hypothetical protein